MQRSTALVLASSASDDSAMSMMMGSVVVGVGCGGFGFGFGCDSASLAHVVVVFNIAGNECRRRRAARARGG